MNNVLKSSWMEDLCFLKIVGDQYLLLTLRNKKEQLCLDKQVNLKTK